MMGLRFGLALSLMIYHRRPVPAAPARIDCLPPFFWSICRLKIRQGDAAPSAARPWHSANGKPLRSMVMVCISSLGTRDLYCMVISHEYHVLLHACLPATWEWEAPIRCVHPFCHAAVAWHDHRSPWSFSSASFRHGEGSGQRRNRRTSVHAVLIRARSTVG
jgi:hypothetical protein